MSQCLHDDSLFLFLSNPGSLAVVSCISDSPYIQVCQKMAAEKKSCSALWSFRSGLQPADSGQTEQSESGVCPGCSSDILAVRFSAGSVHLDFFCMVVCPGGPGLPSFVVCLWIIILFLDESGVSAAEPAADRSGSDGAGGFLVSAAGSSLPVFSADGILFSAVLSVRGHMGSV